jgi:hypothetical protein
VENTTGGGSVIGIHTNGACTSTGGTNYGTAVQNASYQAALANPLSLCATGKGTVTGTLFAVSDGANNFGTCNTATGNFAKVAVAPPRMTGLAYAWTTGKFYGVSNDTYGVAPGPAGRKLWTIDPASGAATYIANLSGSAVINGLGFDPASGTLFGIAEATGQLYSIDTATGSLTAIGAAAGGTVGGLAFDPFHHVLYGIDDAGGSSSLVTINTGTGARTAVGSLGAGIANCNGLAITQDGALWTINSGTEQLLRVDAATGIATVIGPTGGMFGASVGMSAVLTPPAACYANCDRSTTPPVLNVLDFTCFLERFAASDPYANCDASTVPPVLNVLDFTCFLQKFAAGCQ